MESKISSCMPLDLTCIELKATRYSTNTIPTLENLKILFAIPKVCLGVLKAF